MRNFEAVFVKPCRIVDYCYGKSPFNVEVDPIENDQLAAILVFCYNG